MSYLSCLLPKNVCQSFLLICFIIPIFFITTVKAQGSYDSKYALAIGTNYDGPVGNLSYTFKPAINYNLSFIRTVDNLSGSINFGYHKYKPKLDTFYYQLSDTEYGTIHYEDFSVFSLYAGLVYNLELTNQLKLYGGLNLGWYYTHLADHQKDLILDSTDDFHEQDVYIATPVGLTYALSDHIGIGVEGKYNLFAPAGDKRYDSRVGTLYNTYSAGVRFIYNF